jgi:hypothetical protein
MTKSGLIKIVVVIEILLLIALAVITWGN